MRSSPGRPLLPPARTDCFVGPIEVMAAEPAECLGVISSPILRSKRLRYESTYLAISTRRAVSPEAMPERMLPIPRPLFLRQPLYRLCGHAYTMRRYMPIPRPCRRPVHDPAGATLPPGDRVPPQAENASAWPPPMPALFTPVTPCNSATTSSSGPSDRSPHANWKAYANTSRWQVTLATCLQLAIRLRQLLGTRLLDN